MRPSNLLFIMSDEHSRRVLGCHGHPMILYAEPGRAGGARCAVHRCLLQLADLRALARQFRHRPLRASGPVLGQRHPI